MCKYRTCKGSLCSDLTSCIWSFNKLNTKKSWKMNTVWEGVTLTAGIETVRWRCSRPPCLCESTSSRRWVHARRWCRFSCRGPPLDRPPPLVRIDAGEYWCLWSTCCSSPPCAALPQTDRHTGQISLTPVPHAHIWPWWKNQPFTFLLKRFCLWTSRFSSLVSLASSRASSEPHTSMHLSSTWPSPQKNSAHFETQSNQTANSLQVV